MRLDDEKRAMLAGAMGELRRGRDRDRLDAARDEGAGDRVSLRSQ
jgi:hypothetical protein